MQDTYYKTLMDLTNQIVRRRHGDRRHWQKLTKQNTWSAYKSLIMFKLLIPGYIHQLQKNDILQLQFCVFISISTFNIWMVYLLSDMISYPVKVNSLWKFARGISPFINESRFSSVPSDFLFAALPVFTKDLVLLRYNVIRRDPSPELAIAVVETCRPKLISPFCSRAFFELLRECVCDCAVVFADDIVLSTLVLLLVKGNYHVFDDSSIAWKESYRLVGVR